MGAKTDNNDTGGISIGSAPDFIVVGQGLSGSWLSYYLLQAGNSVIVVDDNKPFTASKVASGVINPVTGRRIVRTWMIEELLPFATREYRGLGEKLGVSLVKECSVLDFHPSFQMKDAFEKRLPQEPEYLHRVDELVWKNTFNFHFGVIKINPCLLIDIHSILSKWRNKLQTENMLLQEAFDLSQLKVTQNDVTYKGVRAKKVIFCDGVAGAENPFFKNLPYAPNKGEAVIARIPGLSTENIYKQGFSIVPWKEDLFWIGSSYEWDFIDVRPTVAFKDKVKRFLDFFLKLSYEIVERLASVRPANIERRPFAGLHPQYENIGILNGMGTKGSSLAPYFAKQLAGLLVEGKPVAPEADVKRFEKILLRKTI